MYWQYDLNELQSPKKVMTTFLKEKCNHQISVSTVLTWLIIEKANITLERRPKKSFTE